MLLEFSLHSQNGWSLRCVSWMQKAGNQEPALPTQQQNVKICIACARDRVFLLCARYLFPWFGFDASEFTCANLEINGDQFHDLLSGGSYVSTQRIRSVTRTLLTRTSSRLRQ